MKFHLSHTPKSPGFHIDHHHKILLIGSCFAENIGNYLRDLKFRTLVNPNGILFNPLSIYNCLDNALHSKKMAQNLVLERDGLFFSYLHHSSFSGTSRSDLVQKLNAQMELTHQFLEKADVLIVTFGTAFVYHHKHLGQTVANCHKQDADIFDKKLLEVSEITETYCTLIRHLKKINPGLKLIFTVSPVKYLRDGIEENSISKSTLLLSINKLVSQHDNCFYFPAYELVTDDLRDYRFYKEDLAHPNQMAIDYAWKKFSDCYFDPKTILLNTQIHKLNQALNHRQMHKNNVEAAKLADYIEKQKQEIRNLDSGIEFE